MRPDHGSGLIVREVVTRILHQLRDDGLVQMTRNGIVLRDPIGLARELQTVPDGPTASH